MNGIEETLKNYYAAWLEPDPAKRLAMLERVFADDGELVSPDQRVRGRDELNRVIAALHSAIPGHRQEIASAIDAHGENARFDWRLRGPSGNTLRDGVGFVQLGPDGRIRRVVAFYGLRPPEAT